MSNSVHDLKPGELGRTPFDSYVNLINGDVLNINVENIMNIEFIPLETMVVYGVWFYRSEEGKLYFFLDEGSMGVSPRGGFLYPVPQLFGPNGVARITQVRETNEVLQLYEMAGLQGFPFRSPRWPSDGNSSNG